MKVPWPLSAREVIAHYFELEFFEDDLIIVILDSISDTEFVDKKTHGFSSEAIPEANDIVRIGLVGGFALQKVTSNRSYFRTMATVDVKVDFIPPSFINFVSRQIIGSGFKLYQKAVASVAKGDEDFGKALKDTLYARIREGLNQETKLKKALEQEKMGSVETVEIFSEEPSTESLQYDIEVKDQISHGELSDRPVAVGQTSLSEIDNENIKQEKMFKGDGEGSNQIEVEQEIKLDGDGINHIEINQEKMFKGDGEGLNRIEVEQEMKLDGDGINHIEINQEKILEEDDGSINHIDQSSTSHTVEQSHDSQEKRVFIRPQVEHALSILNDVISLVREGGLSFQTWYGLPSTDQQVTNTERVAVDVDTTFSQDESNGEASPETPTCANSKDMAFDGDENENGSALLNLRPSTEESPHRETNLTQVIPTLRKQLSSRSETAQCDNLKDNDVALKPNGIHEADFNGGEKFKLKKKHRVCCFHFYRP